MRLSLLLPALMLLQPNLVAAEEHTLAPDWSLQSAGGAVVRLSDAVRERPVILFFWATWCPYCKALMPHIQSIRLEHGDAIRVLAVHFRDDEGDPVEFMENAGYDFTLLPDGDEVAKLSGVWGTPGVLIVDRDMVVRFDLYTLPKRDLPDTDESPSHRKKAAYRAPYWAAEIRKSLRVVLSDGAD